MNLGILDKGGFMYKIVTIYHSGKEVVTKRSSLLIAEQLFDRMSEDKTVKKVMLKHKNEMLKRT